MAFRLFGRGDGERLEGIEEKLQLMLTRVREEFDLAMSALLGDVAAAEVNLQIRALDREVNGLEREIRRELLVHTSVAGAIDTPVVLVYMSVVKDIERVGDYSKNLLDLARDGANMAETPERDDWRRLAAEVSRYITDSAAAFGARDERRSRELLRGQDKLLGNFDSHVSELVRSADPPAQAVAVALAYRYMKRVTAHLMNLLSAVVMPLDRLDFFDERGQDRGSRSETR